MFLAFSRSVSRFMVGKNDFWSFFVVASYAVSVVRFSGKLRLEEEKIFNGVRVDSLNELWVDRALLNSTLNLFCIFEMAASRFFDFDGESMRSFCWFSSSSELNWMSTSSESSSLIILFPYLAKTFRCCCLGSTVFLITEVLFVSRSYDVLSSIRSWICLDIFEKMRPSLLFLLSFEPSDMLLCESEMRPEWLGRTLRLRGMVNLCYYCCYCAGLKSMLKEESPWWRR